MEILGKGTLLSVAPGRRGQVALTSVEKSPTERWTAVRTATSGALSHPSESQLCALASMAN